jgi:cephalosporin-C deacetylase-like acetyl esterase
LIKSETEICFGGVISVSAEVRGQVQRRRKRKAKRNGTDFVFIGRQLVDPKEQSPIRKVVVDQFEKLDSYVD